MDIIYIHNISIIGPLTVLFYVQLKCHTIINSKSLFKSFIIFSTFLRTFILHKLPCDKRSNVCSQGKTTDCVILLLYSCLRQDMVKFHCMYANLNNKLNLVSLTKKN